TGDGGSRPGLWQAGWMLTIPARLLGDADRAAVERVLDQEPIAGAQVAERVAAAGLSRRSDGRLFGYGGRRRVDPVRWSGANLMPVRATGPAIRAFAEVVGVHPRICSSLVGEAESVLGMWSYLSDTWGPARDVRPNQPLLATWSPPRIPPDPTVRLVRPQE